MLVNWLLVKRMVYFLNFKLSFFFLIFSVIEINFGMGYFYEMLSMLENKFLS